MSIKNFFHNFWTVKSQISTHSCGFCVNNFLLSWIHDRPMTFKFCAPNILTSPFSSHHQVKVSSAKFLWCPHVYIQVSFCFLVAMSLFVDIFLIWSAIAFYADFGHLGDQRKHFICERTIAMNAETFFDNSIKKKKKRSYRPMTWLFSVFSKLILVWKREEESN